MSYMQFQQKCDDCGKQWNASFGIVGTTQIAAPPVKCPYCGSENLSRLCDGWKWDSPSAGAAPASEPPKFTPHLPLVVNDGAMPVDIAVPQERIALAKLAEKYPMLTEGVFEGSYWVSVATAMEQRDAAVKEALASSSARENRWEVGIRNIVHRLHGRSHEFEIADIVEEVSSMKAQLTLVRKTLENACKSSCDICDADEGSKHNKGCWLAALLDKLKPAQKEAR